jgi:hypothetical protein
VNSADEIKESLKTKDYLDNGVVKTRIRFVTKYAEKLGLYKVAEENSIHYRHIGY